MTRQKKRSAVRKVHAQVREDTKAREEYVAHAPASRRRRARDELTYQRGHFRRRLGRDDRRRPFTLAIGTWPYHVEHMLIFFLPYFSLIGSTLYRRYRPLLRPWMHAVAWAVIPIRCVGNEEIRALSRYRYQTQKNVPGKLYNVRVERTYLFPLSLSFSVASDVFERVSSDPSGTWLLQLRYARPPTTRDSR